MPLCTDLEMVVPYCIAHTIFEAMPHLFLGLIRHPIIQCIVYMSCSLFLASSQEKVEMISPSAAIYSKAHTCGNVVGRSYVAIRAHKLACFAHKVLIWYRQTDTDKSITGAESAILRCTIASFASNLAANSVP